MAFQNKNLSVLAYANGFTLWHYTTDDDIYAIMQDSAYFGKIWALAACGDVIFITSKGKTYERKIIAVESDLIKLGE